MRLGDQRLHLDQERPIAIDGGDDRQPDTPVTRSAQEQPARILDGDKAGLIHLQEPDFGGGAKRCFAARRSRRPW